MLMLYSNISIQLCAIIELLELICNTWNDLTVCKQMADFKLKCKNEMAIMKPFNCVQTNVF